MQNKDQSKNLNKPRSEANVHKDMQKIKSGEKGEGRQDYEDEDEEESEFADNGRLSEYLKSKKTDEMSKDQLDIEEKDSQRK